MSEIIEAPTEAVETPDIATESPVEGSAGAEGSEVNQGSDEGSEGSSGESLRGSALWRETKSLAQAGKPLTPKLLSAINKAIHRDAALSEKYPDGIAPLEQQASLLRQLSDDETAPVERVIEETLQERNYFRELDSLFSEGKPEFVEKMADASPEAFQNIAPAVFRKYAEVNPEGYSAYVAQAVVQHMNSQEIPLQFRILASFLPQLPESPVKEQVLNAVEALYGWAEGLKSMAGKQIAPKVIPGQQGQPQPSPDREQQLAEREMNATRTEWNSSIQQEGVSFVFSEAAREISKLSPKSPLSDKEKQTVLAKVGEELGARLSADRSYGQAMQGYLKNANKESYLQRLRSERKKLVPGAVRRAVADVLDARPRSQGQNSAKKPAVNQTKQQAATSQAVQGFIRISGHPKTVGKQVDLKRTTHSMLEKKQAYVVGQEKPVTW